jgi:deoxyadenosine/deoxycytidine kinase
MPRATAKPRDKMPAFASPRYIAIEGPIRVGKSTLARFLAERMRGRRVTDCEDNPFLSDFYSEKPGAAFRAQMYFLIERHQRLRDALGNANDTLDTGAAGSSDLFSSRQAADDAELGMSRTLAAATGANIEDPDADFSESGSTTGSAHFGPAVIADFLFEKDKIFAYLNLDNEELKLYERYFARFAAELRMPELVIYLQATPDVLRERIAKKAAPGESRISREYIEGVVRAYEHFFFRYSTSNLLVVNTSEIDFVNRNADLQQLLQRIEEPVKGTQYFLPLGGGD